MRKVHASHLIDEESEMVFFISWFVSVTLEYKLQAGSDPVYLIHGCVPSERMQVLRKPLWEECMKSLAQCQALSFKLSSV